MPENGGKIYTHDQTMVDDSSSSLMREGIANSSLVKQATILWGMYM